MSRPNEDMTVEIRLLGDIELRVDGRVADVGHARQQCVLVALLVDSDRPVSLDQLLFRVWGDHPPQRARDALYSYLSRLRHVLGDTSMIVRQHSGYRVAIDPLAVDLHLFGHLVQRAHACQDGDTTADLLRQALGLWRGDAFSTLDTPWVNSVRDTVQAQRMAALLDCNDLELASGNHVEVVSQLSTCAQAQGLDERLTGQLMLALYRSGRQADALQTYQRIRLRLADELGADPSPALRALHQRMLTSDRALTAPDRVHRPSTVPRQLPAAPTRFTGREAELSALDKAMAALPGQEPTVMIAAIGGPGGIGKTCLAVQWAHSNADKFPDGQLYVNLRGFDPGCEPLAPAAALRAFLNALGLAAKSIPADFEAQVGLYRSLVAGRRMLIVLDNARDTSQVTSLLPGTATCAVLVTSRSWLAGLVTAHGARTLTLDVLSDQNARHLLAGQLGEDRIAFEPASVDVLLAVCGGLPLALGIVAARAAMQDGFALTELAVELAQTSTRLDGLDAGELAANLRAVFGGSYGALSPEAARTFRLLGVISGPDVGVGAAASLVAVSPGRVRALLRQLAAASLVCEHQPGRYRMHDLVRLYAAELAAENESADSRTAAVQRWLDYHLNSAHAAALKLNPQRIAVTPPPSRPGVTPEQPADLDAAMAWLSAEHEVLLTAVHHAAETTFDVHAWQLACALATFFDRQGHWHDRETTQRAALSSAQRVGDRWAQAESHRGLAIAHTWLARYDDARTHLQQALDLFTDLGDRAGQACSYRTLARVWAQQGRYDRALQHDERALALYRAIDHQAGQATALNAIGWHHAHLGDYERALSYCQEALARQTEMGDRHAQAATLDSVGFAHHHLGQHRQAIACYQRALRLYGQTGEVYQKANTFEHLGDTYLATGEVDHASAAWQAALGVLDGLAHADAERIRAKLQRLPRTGNLDSRRDGHPVGAAAGGPLTSSRSA